MTAPQVLVFQTHDELAAAAADYMRRVAQQAVAERGWFYLVLSGGSTPEPLYRRLATPPYKDDLPWSRTHVFWADERAVPPDAEESNYRMAHEALLRSVAIPEAQIHRMHGEMDPATAASHYAQTLSQVAGAGRGWPTFDLVILGLGSDGHTASLFPGSVYALENEQPVLAVNATYGDRPASRITLTPPALNSARNVLFLVTGAEKADAVAASLSSVRDSVQYPAQRIQPQNGAVIWLVDQGAAGKLDVEAIH